MSSTRITLFIGLALLAVNRVQTPGSGARQAPPRDAATRALAPVRDTARPTMQPPATSVVEASSPWPDLLLGGLTLVVLVLQWLVFRRQARLMERQGEIMEAQQTTLKAQHALAAHQMQWRRDEAIGTFYRVAHDLVAEFDNATVLPTTAIAADFGTHPRLMLREASRLLAPLGTEVVFAANGAALRLDQYFVAVEAYNRNPGGRDGAARWETVQKLREQVGADLDEASRHILPELRWRYGDGTDYNFRKLCSPPPGLLGESEV